MTSIVRGDHGRIGFLLPADGLTDDEYWSCSRTGRPARRPLPGRGGLSLEELESDPDIAPILDAVELIRQAKADVAALADCAGAVVGGLDYERDLVDRVAAKLGRPATSTPRAIAAALKALRARRIVLAAPYLDVVVERFAAFLAGFGIETVESKAIAFAAETEIAELGPDEWRAIAGEVDRPDADAVVLGGAGSAPRPRWTRPSAISPSRSSPRPPRSSGTRAVSRAPTRPAQGSAACSRSSAPRRPVRPDPAPPQARRRRRGGRSGP